MHEHNKRNFPQAKFENKLNVCFLLNEHGDLHFLLHKSVHIILFNLKKKRYRWKHAQNRYFGMQIMTVKKTTIWMFYTHIVLNGEIFQQISYDVIPYARHFLPAI